MHFGTLLKFTTRFTKKNYIPTHIYTHIRMSFISFGPMRISHEFGTSFA